MTEAQHAQITCWRLLYGAKPIMAWSLSKHFTNRPQCYPKRHVTPNIIHLCNLYAVCYRCWSIMSWIESETRYRRLVVLKCKPINIEDVVCDGKNVSNIILWFWSALDMYSNSTVWNVLIFPMQTYDKHIYVNVSSKVLIFLMENPPQGWSNIKERRCVFSFLVLGHCH